MPTTKLRPCNPYFKDGVDYSWQAKKEFNDLVKVFRDTYALSPNMKDARQMHTNIIDELMKKLKEKPLRCSRLEYTGSSYEGVNVSKDKDDDDFEFDIMVIIEGGRDLMKNDSETPAGYVLLRPSDGADEAGKARFQKQTTDGYVSADKVAAHFMGQLQTCIDEIASDQTKAAKEGQKVGPDELRHIDKNIILRKHGPAIQMDVYRSSSLSSSDGGGVDVSNGAEAINEDKGPSKPKPFYSVDMVPTFEMVPEGNQKEYYVAKPLKGVDFVDKPKMKFAWRRSFSLDEKDRLIDMDRNNTCKKAIFRMLKVIRNGECGLALLTSYHLKTVLLREIDNRPNDEDWKEEFIGRRLMDVISRLVSELGSEIKRPIGAVGGVRRRGPPVKGETTKRSFRKGEMLHLFIPQINLLDCIDNRACACIYYRLKHLKNSKQQMEAILNKDSKPRRRNKKLLKKRAVAKAAAMSKTPLEATKSSFRKTPLGQNILNMLSILDSLVENSNPSFDNPHDDDVADDDDDNDLDNCDVDDYIDNYNDMIEDAIDDYALDFD